MKLSLTITRDDEDFDIEVEATYHKAYRGQRDSCGGVRGAGPPLEPDEPASFDIESVKDSAGNDIDLSAREMAHVTDMIWEKHNSYEPDYDGE